MKSITKNSIRLFLVAVLLCMPASAFAVTFFIGSGDIQSGAVQTDHIAPYAVTNDKIAPSTITQDKLAFALPSGSKYGRVVVVAISGGDFTDPIAAVASITDASADRPYLVKIMPGKYDLLDASLQMKEYVDVEGSGPENTIITSSNFNVSMNDCTVGTVLMATNSSIRHIRIVNNPPVLNSDYVNVASLVFNNVMAVAEGVTILTGSDTIDGGVNNGVVSCGAAAHAVLNNVSIETHNAGVRSNPIYLISNGSLTLTNSKMTGGSNGDAYPINSRQGNGTGIAKVLNTTIEMNASSPHGFFIEAAFVMINSQLISSGIPDYFFENPSTVKIANSLLPGDRSSLDGAKLVNNFDENFDPIPNQ